jgi:phosphoribosylformylglycinamidine cyclo-ligase
MDYKQMGIYIAEKRKQLGLTQLQLAEQVNVSTQAVSKWEHGLSVPGIEILVKLSDIFRTSIDTIVSGEEQMQSIMSWRDIGIPIQMNRLLYECSTKYMSHDDDRLLIAKTPYPAVYKMDLEGVKDPLLTFMINSAGSKLRFAVDNGYIEEIGRDMVNRLVRDCLVARSRPMVVKSAIVTGNIDDATIKRLCKALMEASEENETAYAGSEISFQPKNMPYGEFTLSAAIVGMQDGSKPKSLIKAGDALLALSEQGIAISSVQMIDAIMRNTAGLKELMIHGKSFTEHLMTPLESYYNALSDLIYDEHIHTMIKPFSIITAPEQFYGLPEGYGVFIDLSAIRPTLIYKAIHTMQAKVEHARPLPIHFNCGIGLYLIVDKEYKNQIIKMINQRGTECYEIGTVYQGNTKLKYKNSINYEME